MFRISKSIETRVSGSVLKEVVCDNCQSEFVYRLTRYGFGSASGSTLADTQALQAQASQFANSSLRRILERAEDPVPCPNCGNYQLSMIPLVRRSHREWMFFVGAFFLIIAAMFSILCAVAFFSKSPTSAESARSYGESAAWMGGIGFGWMLLRKLLSWRIQPNDGDPEDRIRLARTLAMSKAEFEMQRKQSEPDAT